MLITTGSTKPSTKDILHHIEEFERFCMGQKRFSPSQFRSINEELSICTVLMIGKRRYQTDDAGKRLFWRGLDNREYDLGLINNANIMRDYPGFHGKHSLSLNNDMVLETKTITAPNGKNNVSVVTMKDGSTGIGLNYRMALRNAVLKMHLNTKLNVFSLSSLWNRVWG